MPHRPERHAAGRTVDVVVLTMNDRDAGSRAALRAALRAVLARRDVDLRVVVGGNGVVPGHVPRGARTVCLPEGAAVGTGASVLFFDNDAALPDPRTVARLAEESERRPRAAYVQPRVADPVTGGDAAALGPPAAGGCGGGTSGGPAGTPPVSRCTVP
ncbi:hypothetical protein ACL02R_10220 [Streptomyces sp. MS19]|uniref:hypothetical protein n=1 Tax=Streptomyces sp. MS19 TaxID=3385972 RepID=UPI00399FE1A5